MGNKWRISFLVLLLAVLLINNRYGLLEKSFGKANQSNISLPYNTSLRGISVFYDTLKELNYSVEVEADNFLEKNHGNIIVITEYESSMGFNLQETEQWISRGGKLVYLTDEYNKYEYPNVLERLDDKIALYKIGRGKLLIGDINLITNETLLENRVGAYKILKYIDLLGGNIKFNEYHKFLSNQSPSLYRNLPIHIKFILFQLALTLIGLIFYFGKRFGKPKRLAEEVERDENEFLYAAANLYEKSKSLDIIYDSFNKNFKNELRKTFKQRVDSNKGMILWQKYNLPNKEKAITVFNHQKENPTVDVEMIKSIDQLTQILVKRRENAWKKLRQGKS